MPDVKSPRAIPLALIGVGKIAREGHIPAIRGGGEFRLAATVSHGGGVAGTPDFATVGAMAAAHPEVSAAVLCTPPEGRLELARAALAAGLDLMVEKPPAATVAEARAIVSLARAVGRTLYFAWHSRQAAGVAPARAWLADKTVVRAAVVWREDVDRWHPGQA
ncbi:MAG: Gfo/Idh/MocA family oxidoreductase, partial [Caulobacteraceae bacterium]